MTTDFIQNNDFLQKYIQNLENNSSCFCKFATTKYYKKMDPLERKKFQDYNLEDVFLKSDKAPNTTNAVLKDFLKVKLYNKLIRLRGGDAKKLLEDISDERTNKASLNLQNLKALLVFGKNLPEIESSNCFGFYGFIPNAIGSGHSKRLVNDEINYIFSKVDALAELVHFSELSKVVDQVFSDLNQSSTDYDLKDNPIKEAINQKNKIQYPTLFEDLILRLTLDEKLYPILEKNCKRKFEVSSKLFERFSEALNKNGMVACAIDDVFDQNLSPYLAANDSVNLSKTFPNKK
jgi:hypothetical protein